jgi:Ion transport protein
MTNVGGDSVDIANGVLSSQQLMKSSTQAQFLDIGSNRKNTKASNLENESPTKNLLAVESNEKARGGLSRQGSQMRNSFLRQGSNVSSKKGAAGANLDGELHER